MRLDTTPKHSGSVVFVNQESPLLKDENIAWYYDGGQHYSKN